MVLPIFVRLSVCLCLHDPTLAFRLRLCAAPTTTTEDASSSSDAAGHSGSTGGDDGQQNVRVGARTLLRVCVCTPSLSFLSLSSQLFSGPSSKGRETATAAPAAGAFPVLVQLTPLSPPLSFSSVLASCLLTPLPFLPVCPSPQPLCGVAWFVISVTLQSSPFLLLLLVPAGGPALPNSDQCWIMLLQSLRSVLSHLMEFSFPPDTPREAQARGKRPCSSWSRVAVGSRKSADCGCFVCAALQMARETSPVRSVIARAVWRSLHR